MTPERLEYIRKHADLQDIKDLLEYVDKLHADNNKLAEGVLAIAAREKTVDAPPFVVYHQYADKSGMTIIYIGSDKAAAFDALMAFNSQDPAGDGQIKVVSKGEYSPS